MKNFERTLGALTQTLVDNASWRCLHFRLRKVVSDTESDKEPLSTKVHRFAYVYSFIVRNNYIPCNVGICTPYYQIAHLFGFPEEFKVLLSLVLDSVLKQCSRKAGGGYPFNTSRKGYLNECRNDIAHKNRRRRIAYAKLVFELNALYSACTVLANDVIRYKVEYVHKEVLQRANKQLTTTIKDLSEIHQEEAQ